MLHLGDYLKGMVVILGSGTESSLSKLVLDPYAVPIHVLGGGALRCLKSWFPPRRSFKKLTET